MKKEAIIVPKLTLVEWEMQSRKVPFELLLKQWKDEGFDYQKALDSHFRQKTTIEHLAQVLQAPIIHRDRLTRRLASQTKIVFAPGGDNHFQYVARFVSSKQILVGINSDPQSSKGSLLQFKPDDVEYLKDRLEKNSFVTEEWTRLQATLNGKRLPFYGLSEIIIAEYKTLGMSRNIITYRGITEEQKNSGFIISTGSGLTGWYENSVSCWREDLIDKFPLFSQTDRQARFVSRERATDTGSINIGDLNPTDEFEVLSLNKNGIIGFDSDPSDDRFSFSFKRGSRVIIQIATENPLKVAVKNLEGGEQHDQRSFNYS